MLHALKKMPNLLTVNLWALKNNCLRKYTKSGKLLPKLFLVSRWQSALLCPDSGTHSRQSDTQSQWHWQLSLYCVGNIREFQTGCCEMNDKS